VTYDPYAPYVRLTTGALALRGMRSALALRPLLNFVEVKRVVTARVSPPGYQSADFAIDGYEASATEAFNSRARR
jgi:hypothetical protein